MVGETRVVTPSNVQCQVMINEGALLEGVMRILDESIMEKVKVRWVSSVCLGRCH